MSPSDQMGADLKASRKTIRELVEALRPFAEFVKAAERAGADLSENYIVDSVWSGDEDEVCATLVFVDLLRARQAITNAEGKT